MIGVVAILFLAAPAPSSEASVGGMLRGLGNIVGGILTVPVQTLQGTFGGPPLLGTVQGLVSGTVTGVGRTVSGAFQLIGGSVDTAVSIAPLLLPFLL